MACRLSHAGGPCAERETIIPIAAPTFKRAAILDEEWREDRQCHDELDDREPVSLRSGVSLFIEAEAQRIYNERRHLKKLAAEAADSLLDLDAPEERQRAATENLMRRRSPQHVVSPLGKSLPTGGGGGDATGKAKPMKPIRKPSGVVIDESDKRAEDDERMRIRGLSLGVKEYYARNPTSIRRDALEAAAEDADKGIFPASYDVMNVIYVPSDGDIWCFLNPFTYDTLTNYKGLAREALTIYAWKNAGDYADIMRVIDETAREKKEQRRKKAA
jgi:hypothetical protein